MSDAGTEGGSTLGLAPVRRALLSVSDKTDLVPFARALAGAGVELVSTGGTATALAAAGLRVVTVEELTGHPEILDGRVKTLHPRVHGGVLARRDLATHLEAMETHGIPPIDLVCVNLYPFERTVREGSASEAETIEQIDIGGPALMRSAAKNFDSVAVVTSPAQYDRVASELLEHRGSTSRALRADLAAAAFARTCEYDAAISAWMGRRQAHAFADTVRFTFTGGTPLRYGENPHQRGAVYRDPNAAGPSLVSSEVLGGKAISFNNILDAAAGLELVLDLRDLDGCPAAAAVIKHTNACGAACGPDLAEAFERAWSGDPLAAFGGVVVLGGVADRRLAEAMVSGSRFLEVVVADRFDADAARILGERWPNARLVAVGPPGPDPVRTALRSIPGGLLVQERDLHPVNPSDFRVAAGPAPSEAMRREAAFAFTVVKHLKSNAVAISGGGMLLGMGAGCVDRLNACRTAVAKAGDRASTLESVAASDAFFPFADGPEVLIDAGVRCIVQPGGSKRDEETFALCNERGVTCLLTGVRHFRH